MILESLLAVFAPVAVKAAASYVERKAGMSAGERLQLEQLDVERLKALASLDSPPENVSGWVADARAMMRPFVAVVVTLAWVSRPGEVDAVLVSSVWFYLFGERTLTK